MTKTWFERCWGKLETRSVLEGKSELVNAYNNAASASLKNSQINAAIRSLDSMSKQELDETIVAMGFRAPPSSYSDSKRRSMIRQWIIDRRGSFIRAHLTGHPGTTKELDDFRKSANDEPLLGYK